MKRTEEENWRRESLLPERCTANLVVLLVPSNVRLDEPTGLASSPTRHRDIIDIRGILISSCSPFLCILTFVLVRHTGIAFRRVSWVAASFGQLTKLAGDSVE